MKHKLKKIICFFSVFLFLSNLRVRGDTEKYNEQYKLNAKIDLLTLKLAYNDYINTVEKDDNDYIYLVMKSGKKIIYDDKKKKSYDEKLNNPDLQDVLEVTYPLEMIKEVQNDNIDPGRIRQYDLLNEVYGVGEKNISKNLQIVNSYYGNVQFNKENNSGEKLKNTLNQVQYICSENKNIINYVSPISGTFNYRVISGTGRLSAHSYGIAIDLKRDDADYWKWASKEKGSKRISNYPSQLVKVFEENGFIWGGKWAHFDILHFEYRPELIIKEKYFSKEKMKEKENWYDGIEINDSVLNYINKVDEFLK